MKNLGSGILLLPIGAYALFEASQMSQLGAVFPTTAGIVIIAGALILIGAGLWARFGGGRSASPAMQASSVTTSFDHNESDGRFDQSFNQPVTPDEAQASVSPWRLAALCVLLLGWALALKPLGFVITSLISMPLIMVLTGREKPSAKRAFLHLLAAVTLVAAFYLLMHQVLRLAVP